MRAAEPELSHTATPTADPPVRIGVLYNPLSGTNRRAPGILPQMISRYPEVHLLEVRTPGQVHEALIEFARQGINLIVISGGDGTVQATLTAMFTRQPFVTHPRLVVLQAGTTNMIAGDVGLPGDQRRALQRLFAWARSGRERAMVVERPVLRLQVPGHEAQCGMFFGAAIISQGIQFYQQNLHNRGLQGLGGIGLTILRSLWTAVRHPNRKTAATAMTVSVDGRPPQREVFLLFLVTTLNRLFFGLRPFWGDQQGPMRYTAVRTRAPYLLRVLPFLARGRQCRRGTAENGYYSGSSREIRLYLDRPVALDGELYTSESLAEPIVLQCGGSVAFLRLE